VLKRHLSNMSNGGDVPSLPPWQLAAIDLIAGMSAGAINALVGCPMDTVKVKMQTFPVDNPSVRSAIMQSLRRDGFFRGLYAGLTPFLLANMGENAILFLAYGQSQRLVAYGLGQEVDKLKPVGNALAGSCASVFSAMWLCPTEHIKCQLQVRREMAQRDPSLKMVGPVTLSGHIIRTEGIWGLFRGMRATWSREIPGYFCFFLGYEGTKSAICWALAKEKEDVTMAENMVCGSMAGTCFWTGIFPIDSIKSRIQVLGNTGTMLDVAKDIMRTQGPMGFYKGMLPAVIRASMSNGFLLTTYEFVSRFLKRQIS
jgi:solute carrier family 25 ornithine transporter 2/15